MRNPLAGSVRIDVARREDDDVRRALWAYTDDVASRWHGRQATDDEIADALRNDPSEDLFPPHGAFLIARMADAVVGCAGLRRTVEGSGEVKRMWVLPAARGRGIGRRLMHGLERLALGEGMTTLRLDTRSDLVEARRLYAAVGYVEVPAFNSGRYAEHWFEKDLLGTGEQPRHR